MASTSTNDGSTSDGSSDGSGAGGIVDFFMQPIGMAVLGGIVIALVAGYMIL